MAGSGELHQNSDGSWSFRVKSAEGEVVAVDGGAGYASRSDAQTTLQTLLSGGYDGPIEGPVMIACGQEITESITLEADLVCTSAPGLIVAADNITVDLGGFTISGEGDAAMGPGIVFRNVSGSTVQKGTITNFGAGVAINGGANNVVQNVTASGNIGLAGGDFGDGIVVTDSSDNRIEGNTVANNGPFSGISLVGACTANQVLGNTVTDNNMLPGAPAAGRQAMGIRVEGPAADNNRIVGNTVTGSGADGIVVLATCNTPESSCAGTPPNQGNEISANMSHRNGTSGRGDGIRLFAVPQPVAPANTTITDNVADENVTHGISIDAVGGANPGPTLNVVTDNSAHGNGGFDGFDGNPRPACGTNRWAGNDFGRVNQPCVSAPGPPA